MPSLTPLNRTSRGIMPIVPTPFNDDGGVAFDDLRRLVDYYEACGVLGMTILGRMGEAEKLSTHETEAVIKGFLDAARDRVPVLVGISGSLMATVEQAIGAAGMGADGVMLRALNGLKSDDAVVSFFEKFIDKTKGAVRVCVQDDPDYNAVNISLDAWSRISRLEPVFMNKLESSPVLAKLSRIVDAQQAGTAMKVALMPSANGMHLPQVLGRGGDGVMAGFGHTDLLVAVFNKYSNGQVDAAMDLHDAISPLMRYKREFPLVMRKEILRRKGVIGSNHVRYPGARLERRDVEELDQVLARMNARLADLSYTPMTTF